MIVYLNGRYVPAEEAVVSVFDRGFLYGDGLFESIRVYDSRPFLWDRHVRRLEAGARALRIRLPISEDRLLEALRQILSRNTLGNAVVRITLSRGQGPRGYSIRGSGEPTLVMAAFPADPLDRNAVRVWKLHTSQLRIPSGSTPGIHKTTSKLVHVLARAEAEDHGADEALILDTEGHVAETASANVFWLDRDGVHTPALASGGLAGVTRGWLLDTLPRLGWRTVETSAPPEALYRANAVFLTVSSLGLVDVSHLDGTVLARDSRTERFRSAYADAVVGSASDHGICG